MRHCLLLVHYFCKKIIRICFYQCFIFNTYLLQRIRKAHIIQLIFCDMSGTIFSPKYFISPTIYGIKLMKGVKVSLKMILFIHVLKRIAGIFRKCPNRIIQIYKYALIHIHSIIIKKGLCLIETQPLYGIIYILFYFT